MHYWFKITPESHLILHGAMPVLQPRTFMLWKTKYITEILEMSAIRFSSQFWPQWWWHPELQPDCRQPLFWIEFGGLDCDIIWKSPSFGAVMKNETKHHNNKSQIRHTMILLKSKQRGQKIDKDFAHGEVRTTMRTKTELKIGFPATPGSRWCIWFFRAHKMPVGRSTGRCVYCVSATTTIY